MWPIIRNLKGENYVAMNRLESLGHSRSIDAEIIEFGRYNLKQIQSQYVSKNEDAQEWHTFGIDSLPCREWNQ